MRQDSEDLPVFKKLALKAGARDNGEQVANSKLMVEGLNKNTPTALL